MWCEVSELLCHYEGIWNLVFIRFKIMCLYALLKPTHQFMFFKSPAAHSHFVQIQIHLFKMSYQKLSWTDRRPQQCRNSRFEALLL